MDTDDLAPTRGLLLGPPLWVILASLFLGGCGTELFSIARGESSGTPIARAVNGGQASFTLTTCAPTTERARMVEEVILQLNSQGVISSASGPGTQSRVVMNLCGGGGPPPAPVNPSRRP